MKEFKNIVIKCKEDDNFSQIRNVKSCCNCDFMINEDDVYSVTSVGYFDEEIKEYYTICPICGYINLLNESRIPENVKKKADQRSEEEPFLYRKNNLKSEIIYLDRISVNTKILKKTR